MHILYSQHILLVVTCTDHQERLSCTTTTGLVLVSVGSKDCLVLLQLTSSGNFVDPPLSCTPS